MILAWDHIAKRFLDRISSNRAVAGKIESIRLLAIHDAVHAVFASGGGCVFNGTSAGSTLDAAMAATAQASHDVLAAVFDSPEDLASLTDTLEESLALISDDREKASGAFTGAESAATFARIFPLLALSQQAPRHEPVPIRIEHRQESSSVEPKPLRLENNPHWPCAWQRSA